MVLKSKNSDMPLNGWWDHFPKYTHKWIRLARFDRPIGTWLLLLPCLWTLPLSNLNSYELLTLSFIFFVGAFLMRSAGCIINDLWDRDIDKNISRTMLRPIASGEISTSGAIYFLIILLILALICLLHLSKQTWIIALSSVPLIIIYPLAKRFTRWPQVILGLVFSWGVPTAWIATGESLNIGIITIYIGTIFWVIGYDTIYGCQDRLEDKFFGVKNSAISAENFLTVFILIIYSLATFCLLIGGLLINLHMGWFLGLALMSIHLFYQCTMIKKINREISLKIFQSNKVAGLFLVFGSLSNYLDF